MKHPYISTKSNNLLFYAKDTAALIGDESNFFSQGFKITVDESEFENNTHEYLQNTYGEVQSPEHAEFIIELCKNHGIVILNNPWESATHFTISHNQLFFLACVSIASTELKKITIPLPPKADKQESNEWPKNGDKCISNNEVCVFLFKLPFGNEAVIARDSSDDWDVISVAYSDLEKPKTPKQESGDWPQIGDEAITISSSLVVILGIDGNTAWVRYKDEPNIYNSLSISNLSKPKTPEEELCDEIVEVLSDSYTNVTEVVKCKSNFKHYARDLIAKYDIKKKPQ